MQDIADNHGVMLTHDLNDKSKPIEKRGVTFYVNLEPGKIRKVKYQLNLVCCELLRKQYILKDICIKGCVYTEDDHYMFDISYIQNEQHQDETTASNHGQKQAIPFKVYYAIINADLDIIGRMRKHYIERIQEIIHAGEVIDLYDDDNEGFRDKCEPAFVSFFDHHMDCTVQEEVNSFSDCEVDTDSASVCYEDMTITEVMQCYRCIVEYKEWKETGKITYE